MTLDEFVEQCRKHGPWHFDWDSRAIRNAKSLCPLQAVSWFRAGCDYRYWARGQGLDSWRIMRAADGRTHGKYRKALETLVTGRATAKT